MKRILTQFYAIWKKMRFSEKGTVIFTSVFVLGVFSCFIFNAFTDPFIPLYPPELLSTNDNALVRDYLETEKIPFEEKKETGILVKKEDMNRVRVTLDNRGIPKQEQKGFELFDSNTWIKGEKELQVLEMRALKGQIEKDLCEYKNIKNANVILDLAPPRVFGGTLYKTKASVILSLMPGAKITASQLRAITFHLAGAVRGLEPHMIAISDTNGRLYQAIDPEKSQDSLENSVVFFEEKIQEKVDRLLEKLVGPENFYSTVQAVINSEAKKPDALSVLVLIERSIFNENKTEFLWRQEIESHLKAIFDGYNAKGEIAIQFVSLAKKPLFQKEAKRKIPYFGLFSTFLFFLIALGSIFPLFRRYAKHTKKGKKEKEEELFRFMTKVDLTHLARSIEDEKPETIAFLLSYLAPARAEKILMALPEDKQEKVLLHLSEMEQGDA